MKILIKLKLYVHGAQSLSTLLAYPQSVFHLYLMVN